MNPITVRSRPSKVPKMQDDSQEGWKIEREGAATIGRTSNPHLQQKGHRPTFAAFIASSVVKLEVFDAEVGYLGQSNVLSDSC